uniref:Uncharacterized protein n=1 Tax=viral metagenome TaxID=1070528 RepID=A0A6C0C047_9ZZZZ
MCLCISMRLCISVCLCISGVHTINPIVVVLMANTWTRVAQSFHNLLRKAFQQELSIFATDVRKLTFKERSCARECAMRHSLRTGETSWDPAVQDDSGSHLECVYRPWTDKYGSVKDSQQIKKGGLLGAPRMKVRVPGKLLPATGLCNF